VGRDEVVSDDDVVLPSLGVDPDLLSSLSRIINVDTEIVPNILGDPLIYTAEEVCELTGSTPAQIQDFARWIGRAPKTIKDLQFAESDIRAIKYAKEYSKDEHIDYDAMGSTIRGIAHLLNKLALLEVESTIQHTASEKDVSDSEARLLAAETALPKAAERLLPLVAHIWRRQYAEIAKNLTSKAIMQRGLYGDDHDYPLLRAVGFADLVNFTARTKNATVQEFTELIRDFTDKSWDIVHDHGGRIVNYIGDAVFYVADDVPTGADIALALAEYSMIGKCGPARVGMVWTRVLATNGDVFGPGVNLASRISSAAEPGEVLIGPAATAQLMKVAKYQVVPQPPFIARGIGTIPVSRLRYANDPRNQQEPVPLPQSMTDIEPGPLEDLPPT